MEGELSARGFGAVFIVGHVLPRQCSSQKPATEMTKGLLSLSWKFTPALADRPQVALY